MMQIKEKFISYKFKGSQVDADEVLAMMFVYYLYIVGHLKSGLYSDFWSQPKKIGYLPVLKFR
jgi:hypothetical protein